MIDDQLVETAASIISQHSLHSEETKKFLDPLTSNREDLFQALLKRPNISWQDLCEIELELHDLRIAQMGQRPNGRPKEDKKVGWGLVDTAKELGRALGSLSEDLQLAQALKFNPSLRAVKDRTTALKLIKRTVKREEAALDSLLPAPNMDQILLGDSLDILKMYPDSTFDACITDPPWTEYKDPDLCADANTVPVFKEVFRVLKPNAFLYAVVSTPDFISFRSVLPTFGFRVQDYPIIWKKLNGMTHGSYSWNYARDFEPILLAVKGNPVLTSSTELSSILEFPIVHHTRMIHPNEKPIELAKQLIRHCTFEGGKVLDPFAGSGVFLHAAKELDRRYVGIERNSKAFSKIERRLK